MCSVQILSCVPDRQRTLRELSVGKTLVKEGDTCAALFKNCNQTLLHAAVCIGTAAETSKLGTSAGG
jgi:hypothetical protein